MGTVPEATAGRTSYNNNSDELSKKRQQTDDDRAARYTPCVEKR